jgi:AcrR family transcriptional regulator
VTRTPYSSAVRTEAARATRRAIVAAAGELFVEQGYAATTIDAIAERAGVGRKTVFGSVGGKGALLKLVWDWTLVGDDEPVSMSERPAVRAMLAERDPIRLVHAWVEMILDVGSRAAPIGAVVLAAADVDPEVRALNETIRRESLDGAVAFVTHLAGIGGLRAGVTVEQGADACWALINSLLLNLLVDKRDWPIRECAEWLVRVVTVTLLEPPDPNPRTPPAIAIEHHPSRERYEARLDGRTAGSLSYQRTDRLVVFTHTEVDPEFDHLGVAGALARRAFEDLLADGARRAVAVCPFVTGWISQHPAYAALLSHPG